MARHIHIITPVRRGGPWKWGALLTDQLNKRASWRATHVHSLSQVLLSPFHQRCDLVHTAIPISYRFWNKPVILTVRGDYLREKNAWNWMYPKAVEKSDLLTVPSYFLKETLGLDRAIVIPPAVEVPELTSGGDRDRPSEAVRLLTVTNFHFPDKSKGVLEIAKVLSSLKGDHPQVRLSILGDGIYRKSIEEEVRKTEVQATFHGFVGAELFFRASDIFVYSSQHDNTPIALLEAMAHALPVVTTAVGAISELVEHGETGFISQNEKEYKEYLGLLLSDPKERYRIGQAAHQSVIQKFHPDVITPQYEALYRKLV